VRRRDRDALGRFFDLVFPFVYSLAFRSTGDRSSAQDIAQEVFLKVYRAAERLDSERSPYPWLTAITVNTARDLARRIATRAEQPFDEGVLASQQDVGAGPHETLVRKERENLLERALLSLDYRQRMVVLLRDYCGCSHEEIASMVDTSPAAVRKRYSRALDAMRDHIRKLEQ
jgi:RNA polymerase sigma factor (sigma-70 family)